MTLEKNDISHMVLRFEFRNEPIEQVGHAISKHGTLTKLAGVIYTSPQNGHFF